MGSNVGVFGLSLSFWRWIGFGVVVKCSILCFAGGNYRIRTPPIKGNMFSRTHKKLTSVFIIFPFKAAGASQSNSSKKKRLCSNVPNIIFQQQDLLIGFGLELETVLGLVI